MNILHSHIYSGLGIGTSEHFTQIVNKKSNVKQHQLPSIGSYWASKIVDYPLVSKQLSIFENLVCEVILTTLQEFQIKPSDKNLAIIISTTKGNIDLLSLQNLEKYLPIMANKIQNFLNNPNDIALVSNACISGVQAFQMAEWLLKKYDFVLVCGADILTEFVISGFYSFRALSPDICKPFDKNRQGLNLGEAAAAVLLSKNEKSNISILGCSSSNDANHISGPSRTGDGLATSILRTLKKTNLQAVDIQLISAHGTATIYNDEMESLAFQTCGLNHSYVYSLKNNVGHTLGAAGVIEVILAAEALKNQYFLPSAGFESTGTSVELNILQEAKPMQVKNILKTASGFGGGNASLILQKTL